MEFVPASDLRDLADQLVERYPVLLEKVDTERIAFFRELDQESGRRLAFVEKMKPLDKQLNGNFDYKLVVYDKKVQYMSPAQLHVLLLHELLHVGGLEVDQKSGKETVKMIPHSIMDFYEVLTVFGLNWQHDDTLRDPLEDVIDFPEVPKTLQETAEEAVDTSNPAFV